MNRRGLSCASNPVAAWVVVLTTGALLSFGGLGCLGRSPNVEHFILGSPSGSAPGSSSSQPGDAGMSTSAPGPSDVAVLVGPVALPAYLGRPKIARLGPGGAVELDEFGRWLGGFEENFLRAISLGLAQELGSVKVVAYPSAAPFPIDYRVRLHVDDLVFVRAQQVLQVRIRWALIEEKGRSASDPPPPRLFLLETQVPVDAASNEALVRAHEQVLAQLTREIADEIRR